jgi:hypothetical protein
MMKTMVWVDVVLDYPLDAADRRSLYNEEYIASGCVGDFPEGTDVDDTVGTWSTNYVTFGLCLLNKSISSLSNPKISARLIIEYPSVGFHCPFTYTWKRILCCRCGASSHTD